MLRRVPIIAFIACILGSQSALASEAYSGPIIDMHGHAYPANQHGSPPSTICAPYQRYPAWDSAKSPQENFATYSYRACDAPLSSPMTDEEIRDRTIAEYERLNVYALLGSASIERQKDWKLRSPGRFLAGLEFDLASIKVTPDQIRNLAGAGQIDALFEVLTQYAGLAPNDPSIEPIYEIAEELDLPLGIHLHNSAPGGNYFSGLRAVNSNPYLLENVLLAHPNLRLWVVHGAFEFPDAMLAMLRAYPQLRIGIGVHSFVLPEPIFHKWLCSFVENGFADRIMFGSDAMIWPDAIAISIDRTARAPCLSDKLRADIFYNNAARFLRLSEDEMARHHASAMRLSGRPQ